MNAFRLPPRPCLSEPHVHVVANGAQDPSQHQFHIGRDFDGKNGYGQRLALTWHGIDEYPDDYYPLVITDDDRAIAARLRRYVG